MEEGERAAEDEDQRMKILLELSKLIQEMTNAQLQHLKEEAELVLRYSPREKE